MFHWTVRWTVHSSVTSAFEVFLANLQRKERKTRRRLSLVSLVLMEDPESQRCGWQVSRTASFAAYRSCIDWRSLPLPPDATDRCRITTFFSNSEPHKDTNAKEPRERYLYYSLQSTIATIPLPSPAPGKWDEGEENIRSSNTERTFLAPVVRALELYRSISDKQQK